MNKFKFGIEHEVALLRENGEFLDFSNTKFGELAEIIEKLPQYESDYEYLLIGDLKIKLKRWYISCYERFNEDGTLRDCEPKGVEIRTTPHVGIKSVIDELLESFEQFRKLALKSGLTPTLTSCNPFRTEFPVIPPFNEYEKSLGRKIPETKTFNVSVLTYGPDLNISYEGMDDDDLIDYARKIIYCSPFIIPFSFSSPFYDGKLWDGYSVRTAMRYKKRPVVIAYLKDKNKIIKTTPWFTELARSEKEIGRIEFKAIDTCTDLNIYAGYLALLKGLMLDKKLKKRLDTPDSRLYDVAAVSAFDNEEILRGAYDIIAYAREALQGDPEAKYLDILTEMLDKRFVPAKLMIKEYQKNGSVKETLRKFGKLTV